MRGIDHDAPYPCRNGFLQLWRSLVVAMHEHTLHRKIDRLRQRQFAAARYVKAKVMRVHEAADRLV